MTKFFLSFYVPLLLFFSLRASAHSQVLLLTSLPAQDLEHVLRFEEVFRETYRPLGFELVTQRQANLFDLRQALLNREAVGVIWLSHASQGTSNTSDVCEAGGAPNRGGLGGASPICPALLADSLGYDVSGVIQDFSPSLRFFSVVGCHTTASLKRALKKFDLEARFPKVKIVGTHSDLVRDKNKNEDQISEAIRAGFFDLVDSMGAAKTKENEKSPGSFHLNDNSSGRALVVAGTRSCPPSSLLAFPAVFFEVRDRVFHALPPLVCPGASQEFEFSIPGLLLPKDRTPTIFVKAGNKTSFARTYPSLGDFEFTSRSMPMSGTWELRRKPDGTPYGVTSRAFDLMGG